MLSLREFIYYEYDVIFTIKDFIYYKKGLFF